jgi:glycosyltransferase involved in cell wall biosynthesis
MIVKNVEKIIENCLKSTLPFVHEVIIVDTGSTDSTKAVIKRAAPNAIVRDFLPSTHSEAFLIDDESAWGSQMPGPFTSKHMLIDFAAARNFGLDHCTSDYVLWIDSDDVLERGKYCQNFGRNG